MCRLAPNYLFSISLCRGYVKHFSGLIYEETYFVLKHYLEDFIHDSQPTLNKTSRKKSLTWMLSTPSRHKADHITVLEVKEFEPTT